MDAQIMSIVSVIIAFGGSLLALINHKRIRSSCCGKNMMISLDVKATSPRPTIEVKNPMNS